MDWLQAIIIGIVEGITEYLPVSSTGHILLAQRALGIPKSVASDAFAVVIQAGAILAVLGLYFQRVKGMAMGLAGKNPEGLLLVRNLLLAFIPAVIVGLIFKKKIEEHLFGLWPVTAAWFVGGVAILAVAWFRRRSGGPQKEGGISLTQITPAIALFIGVMQCVAMWPGTSRSLMTIVAALLAGLSLSAALEFSFLLGVITLSAASAKDFWEFRKPLFEHYSAWVMLLGLLAAWLSAVLAVKWMIAFLQKKGITPFGYYRIGLAIVVAILLMTKVLPA
ncbi:MAG TPA: undecaprenyl-diphosphate phosphatase [Verrucomicrobiales bacterium]|nr:undecaprenyl-diphosphate phosphatase [Verrucomicrobiales bacterium]